MHVAIMAEPKSIPVWEIMAGLTKMIYAMVMKVVRPPITSVRTVVLAS
jgi:hypothetical protein